MKLKWIDEEPTNDIEIHQVYAVVFNEYGKILLKVEKHNEKKSYSLAGGTPEIFDYDYIATLKREYLEELNTSLKDPIYYLGYQLVDEENGISPYAQIRMTAMIGKIGKKQPDPDNNKTYDRILVSPHQAIKLLNWGEIGEKIIKKAVQYAKNYFKINFIDDEEIEEV